MTLATRLTAMLAVVLLHIAATRPATHPPVVSIVFNHVGSLLFAARHDSLQVLAARDGSVQHTLRPELRRLSSLALSPGGQLLAIAGGSPGVSGQVLLIDLKTHRTVSKAEGFDDLATSVRFSPDGSMLAVASADRTTRLFVLHDGGARLEPAAHLTGHTAPVLAVLFSPDARLLITASADRSIKVWDAASGRLARTLTNHTDSVHAVAARLHAVDADAVPFAIASASDDRTVRVWQPGIGRMVRIVRGHDAAVLVLAYAPDGSALFSASADGTVRQIDPDSDRIVRRWKASEDWVYALAISPDGRSLASGDWSGRVRLWRLGDGEVRSAW